MRHLSWRLERCGDILRANGMNPEPPIADRFHNLAFIGAVILLCVTANGQANSKAPFPGGSSGAERGIALASRGRCKEALPILKKASAETTTKDLKYDVLLSTARCAIGLEQTETAVRTLLDLNRSFSKDPEVLYLTTHYYSELALKASHELAAAAPSSAPLPGLSRYFTQQKPPTRRCWDRSSTPLRIPSLHGRNLQESSSEISVPSGSGFHAAADSARGSSCIG
jgi:hypothetical protein